MHYLVGLYLVKDMVGNDRPASYDTVSAVASDKAFQLINTFFTIGFNFVNIIHNFTKQPLSSFSLLHCFLLETTGCYFVKQAVNMHK